MKKFTNGMIIAFVCIFGTATMVFAGEPGNNVVDIEPLPGMVVTGSVLNKDSKVQDIAADTRFTGAVIEKSIEQVREELITVKNSAEDMVYKKRNPIKGDLQNFEVGSSKDITDLMTSINNLLGIDKDLFSEKDPVAVPMIPIGNTDYKMPSDTVVNVIGGSSIQAYPLKVDGKVIGHFRVVAGGYLKEDVLINNDSVSYLVASIMTTGVSRNSGVHKNATTKLFFTGVSEPYMVGKVASVKIHWNPHPKSTAKGLVNFYNLDKVPYALATLDYNTTITMADGTKLSGTNAQVGK